jgi:hypothetical protein
MDDCSEKFINYLAGKKRSSSWLSSRKLARATSLHFTSLQIPWIFPLHFKQYVMLLALLKFRHWTMDNT